LTEALTQDQLALLRALEDYRIGPEDVALTFTQRLSRENGWKPDFTARVFREYMRFCFLARHAGHAVTPSDAVDQAWHLHLTYSRDYWDRFCPQVLGMELHHGPTAGGAVEGGRYYNQYAATLQSYERLFGQLPPDDIWPSAVQRFGPDVHAIRVHTRKMLILDRKRVMVAASLLVLLGFLLGRGF